MTKIVSRRRCCTPILLAKQDGTEADERCVRNRGLAGMKMDTEEDWSGREDLNLRPPGPEPGALPG
jgi:hypothetical protein